jgi:membrane protein implicated in regulation of membrane protease activity
MSGTLLRRVCMAMSLVLLIAMTIVLGWLFYSYIHQARLADDPDQQRALARLAMVAAALLCVVVVLLAAVVIRAAGRRVGRPRPHRPTTYVDAWALAGQRVQLDEQDGSGPDQSSDQDDEDAGRSDGSA